MIEFALHYCFQTAKPGTVKQATVARPMTEQEVAALIKRQQQAAALQQKVPGAQIIAGTQLQQVRAASVCHPCLFFHSSN